MTDRERLIEILRVKVYPKIGADPTDVVADYLLDNGVIVPPCKVGQKLYTTMTRGIDDHYIQESVVTKIEIDDFLGMSIIAKTRRDNGTFYRVKINQERIGKTIFFSLEEAEASLNERRVK